MAHVTAQELVDGLRRMGMRVTKPRQAICRVLAKSHDDHLTAAELHRRAEESAGTSIDASTVYRTIDTLQTTGLLHHVHLGHGPSVIHLSERSDHHHLVCEVCGRTVDIPLADLRPLTRHIEESHSFVADSVHFALVGRCADHDRNDG